MTDDGERTDSIRDQWVGGDRKGGQHALISNHNLHFWARTSLQTVSCLHFLFKILDLEKANPKSSRHHFLSTRSRKHRV